ncbi:MAG: pantoate--beta-alanine ligase [Myxococcota bacterium]
MVKNATRPKAAPKGAKAPKAPKVQKVPLLPGVSAQEVKKGEALVQGVPGGKAPKVIESVALMQAASLALRQRGATVAVVPTMGALHQGHLSLVEEARKRADVVVLTIFVNPTQFGPGEDYEVYPRDKRGDLMKCQAAGVDVVFMPDAHEMYPEGFQTQVSLGAITQGACGRYRPGHFSGVATVVLKLFHVVQPQVAIFGEKDWQQLQVIRRMVRDLNHPVEVVGGPIIREPDGLAMSSRNLNLTPRDREQASVLSRAIARAQEVYAQGVYDVAVINRAVIDEIKTARGVKLQYVEIVDASSLTPLRDVDRPARVLIAAHLGNVRLIDNGPLGPEM